MPANKDVQDFYELRAGFLGMRSFADAALNFMDKNGIALTSARQKAPRVNGASAAPAIPSREKIKAHFTKQRGGTKNGNGAVLQDTEDYLTADEAAKVMKCSNANVRLMWHDGRLPKPQMGLKYSKKLGRNIKVMVVPKEAVTKYLAEQH